MIRKSILILAYNNQPELEKCLTSLAPTLERDDVECLVLDNGSEDGTISWLYTCALPIRALFNAKNLGVSGGRERLLEQATGDILIFLDSDTVIKDKDWLDKLCEPLEQEEIGLTGCAGSYIDWRDFHPFKPADVGECDVVSGWCQAFKRELLSYGLKLDHEYGLFFEEDSDFCMQVNALGWYVWNVGYIGVAHKPSNSGKSLADRKATLQRFRDKWLDKGLTIAEES